MQIVRIAVLLSLAALCLGDTTPPKRQDIPLAGGPPIQVFIGSEAGVPNVTVTFPGMRKSQLADILAILFARDQPDAEAKLRELFARSSEVTIALTTKRTDHK